MFELLFIVVCKIKNVNMDGIDFFLKYGVEVNLVVVYSILLMYVCENENIEFVEKFLEWGVSVNFKNIKEFLLIFKLK